MNVRRNRPRSSSQDSADERVHSRAEGDQDTKSSAPSEDAIDFPQFGTAARASVVNRTHRVIRDQALSMRAKKQQTRSLWLPLGICSSLLIVMGCSVWSMLDGYDLTPNGVPDASDQMMILLIWLLPVTALAMGLFWFRRARRANGEVR